VSFGASYGIFFVPAFDFPFRRTAREVVRHPEFPARTGVAFVQVCNREEIRLRVWEGQENGSSCAAAAAAVVAAAVSGFSDREVFVHLAGGDLFIQWKERDNRLYVTGPAAYVFTGTYEFEEEPG
jgi:diaminopimelate epimerase